MSDLSYLPPNTPLVQPFAEPRAVPLRMQVVGPEPTLRGLLRAAHDLELILKRLHPGFWSLTHRYDNVRGRGAVGWIEREDSDTWRVELWSHDGRLRTSLTNPSYAEVDLAGRLLGLGRRYLCYLVYWS